MRDRPNYSWLTEIRKVSKVCESCNNPIFWWMVMYEIETKGIWCCDCIEKNDCNWPEEWAYIIIEDYDINAKFYFYKDGKSLEYFK